MGTTSKGMSAETKKLLERLLVARVGSGMVGRDLMLAMEQLTKDEYTAMMTAYAAALLAQMGVPEGAWPTTEQRDDFGFRDVRGPHRQPMIDAIMSRLMTLTQASSVVDLGCGAGGWLASCLAHGAKEVLGVDAHPPDEHLQIPAQSFRQLELREPIDLGRGFDVAVCLWLGECVEERYAETVVRNCTAAAPVVCFSAATPLMSGPRPWFHEQWPSYWARLFRDQGYVALEILRDQVWNLPEVRAKNAQSLILFVHRDHLSRLPALRGARVTEDLGLLDRVHPIEYLSVCHDFLHVVPLGGGGPPPDAPPGSDAATPKA